MTEKLNREFNSSNNNLCSTDTDGYWTRHGHFDMCNLQDIGYETQIYILYYYELY